ncbi:MAG: CoA pyrophosphatase [Marmoricola sp.]|nr:CoA pyrophosphatase [Marmoricola sp.]MCW2826475.1 CoA pyrophosphatase [Marmoricola sp.]
MSFPDWLEPIRQGAHTIRAQDISRFVPPEGSDARKGAVLMLFGEGERGPDVLLTERAHGMRSHPGQVSFPGGSIDETDASPTAAALREAEEETGLDPSGVEVFGTLPELWLPPSNFAVTTVLGWWKDPSPVAVVDPAEVHSVLREPIAELLDPQHRVTVVHPLGYRGPGFLIGDSKDLILWGFTAGLISKLFDHVGLTRPWDASVEQALPDYMFGLGQD